MFDPRHLSRYKPARQALLVFVGVPMAILAIVLFFLAVGQALVLLLTVLAQISSELTRLYALQMPVIQLVLFAIGGSLLVYGLVRFGSWIWRRIAFELDYFQACQVAELALKNGGYKRGWVYCG